jgi:CheY-like chemotaxis protein
MLSIADIPHQQGQVLNARSWPASETYPMPNPSLNAGPSEPSSNVSRANSESGFDAQDPSACDGRGGEFEPADRNLDRVVARLLHDLQNLLWPAAVQAEVAATEVDCPLEFRRVLEEIGCSIRDGMTIASRISDMFNERLENQLAPQAAPTNRDVAPKSASAVSLAGPKDDVQATAPGSQPSPSSITRMRILCVDNDPNILGVLARSLEYLGHEVELCRSGTAALPFIAKGHFDLVMTDLEMPGLDGRAVTREVRARSQAPVIWVTGQNLSTEVHTAPACDSPDFVLPKPLSLNSLRRALTAVFEGPANQP